MATTRTRNGSLEITNPRRADTRLIVVDKHFGVELVTVDGEHDQRTYLLLEPEQLDELAAEILRIRDERGI